MAQRLQPDFRLERAGESDAHPSMHTNSVKARMLMKARRDDVMDSGLIGESAMLELPSNLPPAASRPGFHCVGEHARHPFHLPLERS